MVPSAELRVYQPLEAFAPHEQAHWERHIVDGVLRLGPTRFRQEVTPAGLGVLLPAGPEGAHVKVLDGRYFVCPWRSRFRALTELVRFKDASAFDDPTAFVPDGMARRAQRELRRMRRREPGLGSQILHSPWHVPVRWFVLFADEERRFIQGDGHGRLSYLTTTKKALRRAEDVVPTLRRSELGPIAELVVELHRWLDAFDHGSILELDYGSLCGLLSWDEMDDDHSARDLHEALRALADKEYPRSADLYQSVLTRAAELRTHESLN